MPVEFHATCDCGYKSRRLRANTCVCRNCKELVDIPRIPFRYPLQPCPICRGNVAEDDILLNLLGEGYLVTDRPSALPCPKCNSSNVQFNLDATIFVIHGVDFPDVGDEIEASIKQNGKLDIPWFTLDAADVQHNIPDTIPPGRVRLRVAEIETQEPADAVMSMIYRFVVNKLTLSFVRTLS